VHRNGKEGNCKREKDDDTNDLNEETDEPRSDSIVGSSNRCFVGNLSFSTQWQGLKDYMRKAGEVVYADVIYYNGRSKGCGIVEYKTSEEAQNAIKTLNETELDDRIIFVREDLKPRFRPRDDNDDQEGDGRGQSERSSYGGAGRGIRGGGRRGRGMRGGGGSRFSDVGRKIFVGNLPFSTSWQDLKDHFGDAGKVIRADVLLDADGRSRGSGVVIYETKEDAQRAISEFDRTTFGGREIYVQEDRYAQ